MSAKKKLRSSAPSVLRTLPVIEDMVCDTPPPPLAAPDVEMTPPPDEARERIRALASSKNIARDYALVERLSQSLRRYHKLISAIINEYPQYCQQISRHYYYNFLGYFMTWFCCGQIDGPQDYSITDAQPGVVCIQRILLAVQRNQFEITEAMVDKLDVTLLKFVHKLTAKLVAIVNSRNTSLAMLELLVPILHISQ